MAANRWFRYQKRRRRAHSSKWSRGSFIQTTVSWLRFLGRFQEREPQRHPHVDLVQDFATFMRDERGLSEVTIRGRCWHVDKFLDWLHAQNRPLNKVGVEDVDMFLWPGTENWSRVSLATRAKALRVFFCHAEIRGWCTPGTGAGIEGPRIFQQESLPVGPAWEDVQRLIANADTDRPRDIRDRAILMLFAIYAFRSSEVASLCVDDVKWEEEMISIARPKQRRSQRYPARG